MINNIECRGLGKDNLQTGNNPNTSVRLPDGRLLEDTRSDAEILKEVYYLINGVVPDYYADVMSQFIHRDATLKENVNGVWTTASQIRQQIKVFKKQNISHSDRKILDEIEQSSTTKPLPGEAFIGLSLEKQESPSLPLLPCSLATADNPSSRVITNLVCDTGSSHASIPLRILRQIKGFKEEDIDRSIQYRLTTPSSTDQAKTIIGSINMTLFLNDDLGTEHQMGITALVLNTNLSAALLDVNTMRKLDYNIGMRKGSEQLRLRLPYKYKTKYFYFSTRRMSVFHPKNVLTNTAAITIKPEGSRVRLRGHLLPGKWQGGGQDIDTVLLHLSEYRSDTFDVFVMVQTKDNKTINYLPGELRLECEASQSAFPEVTNNNINIFLSSAGPSPDTGGQWSEGDTHPPTHPPTRTHQHTLGQPEVQLFLSSSGQNPDQEMENDTDVIHPSTHPPTHPPHRGQGRAMPQMSSIQNLEPIKSNELTEEEINQLEKITLPSDALEDLLYKSHGFFPGLDQADEADWPEMGDATEQEKKKLKSLIMKYRQAFSRHKYEIGKFKGFQASIDTRQDEEGLAGVHEKERPHAPQVLEEAQSLIDGLREAGVVRYATPEEVPHCWTSNFLIQLKPNSGEVRQNSKADKMAQRERRKEQKRTGIKEEEGGNKKEEKRFRFLMDFRKLNFLVKTAPTPTFASTDSLHLRKSAKASYAISFDFCQSYFSICLDKQSQLKTGVWFKNKIVVLERLPQGLKSSSMLQQVVLKTVFNTETLTKYKQEVNPDFDIKHFQMNLLSFSDDFLYLAETKTEALEASEAIFFAIAHHGLKISFSKTRFFQRTYTFLGQEYDLTDRSIRLSTARTDSILSWNIPKSIPEIQSRLAQMSYFSSHLPAFKLVSFLLYALCREGSMRNFGKDHLKAFRNLKFLFRLTISLTIPNPDYRLVLSSDASQIGLSSLAFQLNPNTRSLEVLSMMSRLFAKGALTRPILSKEALGACLTLERHATLIEAAKQPVILLTDSATLQYAANHKITNMPIQSFSLMLSAHRDVEVLHVPSAVNLAADLVSRTIAAGKPRKVGKEEKEELELLNTKIMNPDSKPIHFSHKDIMQILHTPPANTKYTNPKNNYEKSDFLDSPISRLEDILFTPPEQVFFQLGSGRISDAIRAHGLWAKIKHMRKHSNITDLEIQKLIKKHRLDKFDLEVFKMMAEVEDNPDTEEDDHGHGPGHQELRDTVTSSSGHLGHDSLGQDAETALVTVLHQPQNLHVCDQAYCDQTRVNNELLDKHEIYLNKVKNIFRKSISGNHENVEESLQMSGQGRDVGLLTAGVTTQPLSITSHGQASVPRDRDLCEQRMLRREASHLVLTSDTKPESGLETSKAGKTEDWIIDIDSEEESSQPVTMYQSMAGQEGVVSVTESDPTSAQASPETLETIHVYPKNAENFISSVINFLKVTKKTANKQLMKKLSKFGSLDFKTQLILYKRCIKIIQSYMKIDSEDNFSFCQIVPIHISKDSDITVSRGEDCIRVFLKNATIIKAGELRTFYYGLTFLLKKNYLYIRPMDVILSNSYHDIPELTRKSCFPHIFKSYIIPRKTIRLSEKDCIFEIRGFSKERFQFDKLEEPICFSDCDHSDSIKPGQLYLKKSVIPVPVDSDTHELMARHEAESKSGDYREQVMLTLLDIFQVCRQPLAPDRTESIPGVTCGVTCRDQSTPTRSTLQRSPPISNRGQRVNLMLTDPDPLAGDLEPLPAQRSNSIEDEIELDNMELESENEDQLRERHMKNNLTFINCMYGLNKNESVDVMKYFMAHEDYRNLFLRIQKEKLSDYVIKNNLIYRKVKDSVSDSHLRLILPRHVSTLVIRHLHCANGEHITSDKLRIIFERNFSQILPENTFKKVIESCSVCLLQSANYIRKQSTVRRTINPQYSYECITLDVANALPLTKDTNYNSALIGADFVSGFAFCVPLKQCGTQDMIEAMKQLILHYGRMGTVITDMASYFGSDFSKFLHKNGIEHYKVNSKRSNEVGNSERYICLLRERLTRFCLSADRNSRHEWDRNLYSILSSFNAEPRTGTKIARAQLFFGGKFHMAQGDLFLPGSELINKEITKIKELREKSKRERNSRKSFKPGSLVRKIEPTKSAPIIESSRYLQNNNNLYEVLDSCPFTTLLRSKSHGGLTTSLPNSLRLVTFKDYQEHFPQRAINVFTHNQSRKGSQPYFSNVYDTPGPLPHPYPDQAELEHSQMESAAPETGSPALTSANRDKQETQRRSRGGDKNNFRKKVTFSDRDEVARVIDNSHQVSAPFRVKK